MEILNRKNTPAILPVSISEIPEAEEHLLDNGVPVYILQAGTEEIMKLDIIFRAGQAEENIPLLASTVNMMLMEGSENYTADELNKTIDFYGSFVNTIMEKDFAGMTIFFLNKHIEKILELSNEIIFRPAFPETELNSLLKKRLQWFLINREKVQNLASDRFFESIFGRSHPYGRQVVKSDFEGINRNNLRTFHTGFYKPSNMTIIVSGNIHPDTVTLLNNLFGKMSPGNQVVSTNNNLSGTEARKSFIKKKGAVQCAIRIGSGTINKISPDYHGLKILNTILGGYFGSRLMRNIREDKGYTYGINSNVVSFRQSGYKVIGTEVGKKYVSQTIEEIFREIRILQEEPVEQSELDVVRSYMSGEMVRMFDGPFAISDSFRSAWEFGLGSSYYYKLAAKIKTIQPDEIIHLARTYYNIDDLYEIVAGEE